MSIHFRPLLTDLGRRISQISGEVRESGYLFQRCSVLVQCFNAILLHDSIPASGLTITPIILHFQFLPSDAYAVARCPSVCLSVHLAVRLSHTGIESKRLHIASKFFHRRQPRHSSFPTPNEMAIFRRGPP